MDRDDWMLVLSVALWVIIRVEHHRERRRLTVPVAGECIVCGTRTGAAS